MEELKQYNKERSQIRRLFTRAHGEFQAKVSESVVDAEEMLTYFRILEDKAMRMLSLDEKVQALRGVEKTTEEDDAKEFDAAESYREKWLQAKVKFENSFQVNLSVGGGDAVASEIETTKKRNFSLPKLQLKQFDGDIKNWIGFWGQFKKINDDSDIDPEDKFQYLLQATVPGSVARELVESFPPSGANYQKAIEHLKSRYAREELLIEIYVRELLNLVLLQATEGSSLSIGSLYDKLETQLRALESLGVTSDKYAAMLYPLVESALPEEVMKAWERVRVSHISDKDHDHHLSKLLLFLKQEVESEERLTLARSSFIVRRGDLSMTGKQERLPTAAALYTCEGQKTETVCIWCDKGSHKSADCFKVRNIKSGEKKDILKRKGACFRCLRKGHNSSKCKAFVKCMICLKRDHYVILCPELDTSTKNEEREHSKGKEKQNNETLTAHQNTETLLQTLVVKVSGGEGPVKLARVLLDSGSQMSYITKEGARKLQLQKLGEEVMSHCLFGGVETSKETHNVYDVTLQALKGDFKCTVSVLDKNKICGYVPRLETQHVYPVLANRNIQLTDVGVNVPEINLLLGADVLGKLLTGVLVKLDENMYALETRLGWTVMGQREMSKGNQSLVSLTCGKALDISDLWQLETMGIKDPAESQSKKEMEEEVVKHFNETVRVNEEGRYEVRLPWKDGHAELLDNRKLAEKRLEAVTRRLINLDKLQDYDDVLQEWLESGIVETVNENDEMSGHYLPHSAVIKESSLTTKIRPVFDASAKDRYGNSLNKCLEKGPNLIEMIPKLLLQFRKHAIGVTADIRKAFLQISLCEDDRDFLKFLWWKDYSKGEMITLRHCRVVFGVTCSPFLLGATISYHLSKVPAEDMKIAEKLQNSFYVDNCVTSCETKEELSEFIEKSTKMMSSAHFELRGWISSSSTPEKSESENIVPILGLMWDVGSDKMFCIINTVELTTLSTSKRSLLSIVQRIFDPLGFLCPVTLIPKLLMQEAWKEKRGWDEELPQQVTNEFHSWVKHLPLLKQCRIPRRLVPWEFDSGELTIHVFADASKLSYATCIFLRAQKDSIVSLQLVQAKARVAPLGPITIPRLELLAAVIATRLCTQVKGALNLQDCKTYFWSDSTVVLTWIKTKGNWSVFVGNRCEEIRKFSNPEDWHHVPGLLNPADLLSRGMSAKFLVESKWWEGPTWLKDDPEQWPNLDIVAPEDEVNKEKRKTLVTNAVFDKEEFTSRLCYFSSYHRTLRMVGWALRFVHNVRNRDAKRRGQLSVEEVVEAEKCLIRCVQTENRQNIEQKVKRKTQIFEDSQGILRLRTKLAYGDYEENFKYPIVLPSDNIIIERMVMEKHCLSKHVGLQTLLTMLRDNFWIIGGRKLVRRIIMNCVICKRYRSKPMETQPAPLPKERVNCTAVFQVTGVDLAGPFYLKTGEKAWLVLFTCAVFRAVHIELVRSLSTNAFLQALRRFIARRGRVSVIYSDNGTNFTGANHALRELNWEEIVSSCVVERITWKFNPPTAAWWGGWWERLIGMVKVLLRRNLGKASVTYEELSTILCDCEAIINSRPLTYISDEFHERKPLKPADFLHEIPSTDVPDLDSLDRKGMELRWRYLQKLRDDLRQRFRKEYLALLIQQGCRTSNKVNVGDVVLIGADDIKRLDWPLGVVQEVYPGKDGIIRVVKVRTAAGERVRPVQRLYPLEVASSDESVIVRSSRPDSIRELQPEMTSHGPSDTVENPQGKSTRSGRIVKAPKRLDL